MKTSNKKVPMRSQQWFKIWTKFKSGTYLAADAWVIELDLEPQKMILSQKFTHLMRCKNILKKHFTLLCFWDTAVFSFLGKKCFDFQHFNQQLIPNKDLILYFDHILWIFEKLQCAPQFKKSSKMAKLFGGKEIKIIVLNSSSCSTQI